MNGPQYSVVYTYYTDTGDANSCYNLKTVTLDATNPAYGVTQTLCANIEWA